MENTAEVIAQKKAWKHLHRVDRRKKEGSPEDRRELAGILRSGRRRLYDHLECCGCSFCSEKRERGRPWWVQMWHTIFPVVLVLMLSGSAHAFTASWYGTTGDTTDPWKHTTTANGEHFNENALTAASWRWPLGTMVRVTNVDTGRSVVVRINDRGPGRRLYRKGRVIDLTRAAFARIAPLSAGVIKVRVCKL